VAVELVRQTRPASNVVGRIAAGAPRKLPGALLLGAHYDHLGMGGSGSLAPDAHEPHNGADDNASGVAALLEAGRLLAARRDTLERDVWLVAFSGEESGLLGSTHLTREPPAGLAIDELVAMVNLDMVGRLRDDRLSVLGGGSAEEWEEVVTPVCERLGLACELGGDGYGPSDQTPFYAAGVPVLHLFTGTHTDYHKPSDDTAAVNAAGGAQVARLAAGLLEAVADRETPPTYRRTAVTQAAEDSRSSGAWLGTVPDYVGPPDDAPGVLLADVRAGSPAEAAGLRRGDLLVGLGGREIGDIYDFVYALRDAKPGDQAVAVVLRDGQRLELTVTYGKRSGPM
jgi:Zn-dependent M28 family amino/carboxypeptidase